MFPHVLESYLLHLFESFPDLPLIGNGLLEPGKLFLAQGDGDGFAVDPARPLIARTSLPGFVSLQNASEGYPGCRAQTLLQTAILGSKRGVVSVFGIGHAKSLADVSIGQYYNCPIMTTADFPAWASTFHTHLKRLRSSDGPNLHQFEALFASWIPRHLLAQRDEEAHSRNRCWNLRLVFWSFLWQVAQAGASCREAIRQAQSLCQLCGQRPPPDQTSPYCQARSNLPLEPLDDIHNSLVREAEAALASKDLWCGHRVYVVDGTTLTMPDTDDNQKVYPQQSVQKPGCGFPILRLGAFFSLATGLITAWATGHWRQHELGLLQTLWENLRSGELLLGDRGFSGWGVLAQCSNRGVHAVFRLHGARKVDFRKGQRLGRDDRLFIWQKPQSCPAYLTPLQWAQLPAQLTVRLVRSRLGLRGFRTRQVTLVTTLLDPETYSAAALGQLYRRRWEMELTLRNLKTTLQMEHLSCKTPNNVERELRMHLLVHNLVRRLMLEAARQHRVPLGRISFAGALAAARRYGEALLQSSTQRQRRELFAELLRVLAADNVPDRPGRREPRAVKQRPKPYPLLTRHRKAFREIRHQSRYRASDKAPKTR